ncbi:radical SAM family heme chaperone HemW [Candidatus Chlamydia sanziniae]|uniref:Heme chaperone HemW n=1 Tax=Candidatus Chlamydia sanziniae TaxID=1806891 RepID=A0A1A9HYJ6_9CHLA|nr:radical SAM family heme chaperone HemW [Candidatus Chlamydia sanziniae]ANH79114.1 putative radical SAM family enzyme [Candidatus Chlamydia sanziniae]
MVKSPLALYIHIPFCSKKCHYCSFYTIPYKPELISSYCNAIIHEGLRKFESLAEHYFIDTLFFGGGTPSLIPPSELQNIAKILASQAQEITLEANPEHLNACYLEQLQETSINRVSLGVQTFDDPLLKLLGRTHSSLSAIQAILRCRSYGFTNISIDLIYGLPTQSLETFLTDVQQALALPLTHLSIYNLTLDPQTSFYKHRNALIPSIAREDTLATMHLLAEQQLSTYGFDHYELGSYAKPNFLSKHNLYYWTDRPFLGLGVSASQYLDGKRSKNYTRISHYLRAIQKNLPTEESSEILPEKEKIKEALALRLRLSQGVRWRDFPPELLIMLINNPILNSFLDCSEEFLFLNTQGRLFHDTIAEAVMNFSF